MQLLTIFPMLQYDFMRHAFLAAVLIAPLFALLGTMAVNNKMAFFSDALGHSAFTGIGLGVLLGMQEPLLAMDFPWLGDYKGEIRKYGFLGYGHQCIFLSGNGVGDCDSFRQRRLRKIFLLFDWGYSDGRAEGFMDDRDCACCGVCAVGIAV